MTAGNEISSVCKPFGPSNRMHERDKVSIPLKQDPIRNKDCGKPTFKLIDAAAVMISMVTYLLDMATGKKNENAHFKM